VDPHRRKPLAGRVPKGMEVTEPALIVLVGDLCSGKVLLGGLRLPEQITDTLLAQYVTTLPSEEKTKLVREARKRV
jgi:hypothetical protein